MKVEVGTQVQIMDRCSCGCMDKLSIGEVGIITQLSPEMVDSDCYFAEEIMFQDGTLLYGLLVPGSYLTIYQPNYQPKSFKKEDCM